VQCTPDLVPSDITGVSIFDQRAGKFEYRPGPLMANVVLVDEINRTPPKTQAALLEGMQERQVSAGGKRYTLPDPFFVLATQNPVELEGTFPLPEAQLDRFLLRVRLGYPSEEQEERILTLGRESRTVPATSLPDVPDMIEFRRLVEDIRIAQPVRRYIVSLARATREHPEIQVGASPRAVEHLGDAVRGRALLDGREYVLPDDVKALAIPVLTHRLVLTTDARIRDREPEEILREVVQGVPVPVELQGA
jgi:MoxR-like ATPase